METKTYVIRDWFGLFHIFQSDKDFKSVYSYWLLHSDYFIGTQYAISPDDLKEKLQGMGVSVIAYHECITAKQFRDYKFKKTLMKKNEAVMVRGDQWYTLYEVAELAIVPQLRSVYMVKQQIAAGRLKATIVGKGLGTKYSIKGTWLIQFIAKVEAGDTF